MEILFENSFVQNQTRRLEIAQLHHQHVVFLLLPQPPPCRGLFGYRITSMRCRASIRCARVSGSKARGIADLSCESSASSSLRNSPRASSGGGANWAANCGDAPAGAEGNGPLIFVPT